MKLKKRGGFTLVEVIIVLVILAVIAVFLIPSLTGYIDNANEKALTAECRSCVVAAQTIASERYAAVNSPAGISVTAAETLALAEVSGSVTQIVISGGSVTVLSYTKNGKTVTFYREPDIHYVFGDIYADWENGRHYAVGDRIVIGNLIYECTFAHTSNNNAGKKDRWSVVGTTDGSVPSYSFRCHYAAGVIVAYNGHTYKRTSYQPSSSATPSTDSPYWELIS